MLLPKTNYRIPMTKTEIDGFRCIKPCELCGNEIEVFIDSRWLDTADKFDASMCVTCECGNEIEFVLTV